MKTTLSVLGAILLFISCSAQSEYEQVITEFIETHKGVKTDLKVEFKSIEVSDILVSDSITILTKEFEAYKAKKISEAQGSVDRKKANIAKQKEAKNKLVAKALIGKWSEELTKLETDLEKTKNIKQTNIEKYGFRDTSDILAKRAKTNFTFFNPQLQAKQEVNAVFILSADGKQCYNMIK